MKAYLTLEDIDIFQEQKLKKFIELLRAIQEDKTGFFQNGYIELILNNKKIVKINFKSCDSKE